LWLNYTFMSEVVVRDSNGTVLQDGDSVTLTKDLKLKGSSTVIKRGTMVKNIKLTGDPQEIDCRVNKMEIVLRAEFLKKA
jgi:protein PhnA